MRLLPSTSSIVMVQESPEGDVSSGGLTTKVPPEMTVKSVALVTLLGCLYILLIVLTLATPPKEQYNRSDSLKWSNCTFGVLCTILTRSVLPFRVQCAALARASEPFLHGGHDLYGCPINTGYQQSRSHPTDMAEDLGLHATGRE
jgi:hypothetical protein